MDARPHRGTQGEDFMTIADNRVGTVHYTLKDTDGKVLDTSIGQEPLSYIQGVGEIVPGLEAALEGKKAGDKISVTLTPEDAYGDWDEELVEVVTRKDFEFDGEITLDQEFHFEDEEGVHHMVRVTKLGKDDITIDGNHPLAGKALHFDVEVVSVREATEEELDHGHVHGDDGHHEDH